MKVASPSEMRECDRIAIDERGIPGLDLMERAGEGAARCITESLGNPAGRTFAIVCGKGNNGGDGLVVARHLDARGARVRVMCLGSEGDLTGDAGANLTRYRERGRTVTFLEGDVDRGRASALLDGADVIVDAIFGTGFQGAIRPPVDGLIELMNRSPAPIVALDIPSGVNGATGEAAGVAIDAALTPTFGLPKLGLVFHPGRHLAGQVRVIDIGIPADVVTAVGIAAELITPDVARALLPWRRPDAHKGDCGRVAIVGGSVGLTGAVALVATAAVRTGAGLVTAGVPASLNDILEVKLTEAMTRPLAETPGRALAARAETDALALAGGSDVMVLGPGLGGDPESARLARALAASLGCPMVIDADGLNAFQGRVGELKEARGPRVLTPHPGEAARLTGDAVRDVVADPCRAARRLAALAGAVVVLKGATTVVVGDDSLFISPTGNAGMATGGSGDVLSGIIAALIGQGCPATAAAALGVYLHGAAGDLGADRLTQWSLAAGDLPELLPEAFDQLASGEESSLWIR